jgi:hypothetical protein
MVRVATVYYANGGSTESNDALINTFTGRKVVTMLTVSDGNEVGDWNAYLNDMKNY